MARYYPNETKLLDFLVDCFNREIEGLDDVEVWIHTCWGNPNMQKVFRDESYANSDRDLPRPPQGRRLDDRGVRERPQGAAALRAAPRLAEEEDRRRRDQPPHAAGRLPRRRRGPRSGAASSTSRPTSSMLSTDCGFGRQGFNRHLAFYKTAAIPQARNIVLKELGRRGALHPGARTSSWPGISCRTTSRSRT